MDYLVSRFSLIPCNEADPDSKIGEFIKARKLTSLPIFDKCCYFDSRKDKIYLFNIDLKSNRVLGFAIRRLENSSGPKYLIKNYSELNKTGLVKNLEADILSDIDSINNYFNVLNVSFSQPVIVTEGQIDAMFLKNAIATTGISKSNLLLENLLTKSNSLIFFDSDSAGKGQSIELIKKGYRVFLWNKLFTDLHFSYKADRKQIRNIKDVNDLYVFLSKYEPKINFETFNTFILKYFSDSPLDILYI